MSEPRSCSTVPTFVADFGSASGLSPPGTLRRKSVAVFWSLLISVFTLGSAFRLAFDAPEALRLFVVRFNHPALNESEHCFSPRRFCVRPANIVKRNRRRRTVNHGKNSVACNLQISLTDSVRFYALNSFRFTPENSARLFFVFSYRHAVRLLKGGPAMRVGRFVHSRASLLES